MSSNNLQALSFENKEFGSVRILLENNEPIFCLSDVCKVLELTNINNTKVSLEQEFGDGLCLTYPIIDRLGREKQAIFITEPQLYFVLMRSDKPKAKPFRQWVVSEVLPSIRKNKGDSMKLIEIYNDVAIGKEKVNSVNARDLHKALESKQDFSNWIKARIDKLGLIEGIDYVFNKFIENLIAGGRPKIDYYVTIDIAKHIAMMEATDKGREVRKYFIECEKKLQQNKQFTLPQTYKEALLELVKEVEKNEQLTIENKEQKQVIEYQGNKLDNYKQIELQRRYKQELATSLNRNIRLLAEQRFNKDYGSAYTYIYSKFADLHCINEKINIDFLKKNNDYLAECLSIVLSELD